MEGYRFDCPFCDEAFESEAVDSLKDRGTTHLGDSHDAALTSVFAETYGDRNCHGDCEYAFPGDPDDVEGFECPECGYDHFRPFVRRYLYWQIETV